MINILVISTGGTIGSESINGKINLAGGSDMPIIAMYNARHPHSNISFSVKTPFLKLSENVFASDWEKIYNEVISARHGSIDGIIITCGTDTLAYTASAMGMMLGSMPLPIMIVSADYPPAESRSNGLMNFEGAVDFISGADQNGVFVVYAQKGELLVHLSTRINQCTQFTDLVESVDGIPFGLIENHKFIRIDDRSVISEPDPYGGKIPKVNENILYICGYPSADYRFFDIELSKPVAIVHSLYHSGTACVEGSFTSLAEFCARCKVSGVPLYIAPYHTRTNRYVTDSVMIAAGAVPLCDISEVTALVKVMIAYGTFSSDEDINAFLDKTIFCEKIQQINISN